MATQPPFPGLERCGGEDCGGLYESASASLPDWSALIQADETYTGNRQASEGRPVEHPGSLCHAQLHPAWQQSSCFSFCSSRLSKLEDEKTLLEA